MGKVNTGARSWQLAWLWMKAGKGKVPPPGLAQCPAARPPTAQEPIQKFLLLPRARRIKQDSVPRDKKRTEGEVSCPGPESPGNKTSERTRHTNWAHSEGKWDTNQGEQGICQDRCTQQKWGPRDLGSSGQL